MRALAIVHQSDAGPGVFAQAAQARGVPLDIWLIPEGSEPPDDPREYDAVLVFGGAMHADQERAHAWLTPEKALLHELLEQRVPLFGVCLGAQLIAAAAGAAVRRARRPEIGWYDTVLGDGARSDPLFRGLPPRLDALEWHSYEFALPAGATALAWSVNCHQAYRIGDFAWGIQFHAEVTAQDFEAWVEDYRSDEDAIRIGLDPEALLAETRISIERWNALGRRLCGRFLDIAVARRRSPAEARR
ncbi:MAG: type 1 glutamine amidotransferase [Solirubrobacteraceae bacterium]